MPLLPRRRGYDQAVDADLVSRLLAQLPEREQHIVRLRFYEQQSQEQIAAAVGVSQMQVSRLLRGIVREAAGVDGRRIAEPSPERVNMSAAGVWNSQLSEYGLERCPNPGHAWRFPQPHGMGSAVARSMPTLLPCSRRR